MELTLKDRTYYIWVNVTLRRPIINAPNVTLNFDYIQAGILNESRLGFYVNYPLNFAPFSGETLYSVTFGVCSIGGFVTRSDEREQNALRSPYYYRDKRNFFIAINNTQEDLNIQSLTYEEIDSRAKDWSVFGFGGCQLTNYTASASVGNLPRVSVAYVADNISFYASAPRAYLAYLAHT